MIEQSLPEESIFLCALELESAAERATYLDQACGDNMKLRAEVEALLLANLKSGDLFDLVESPNGATDRPIAEQPGAVIGPYKLLQQIGEGGMGVVFMADQTEPIQRTVALKIIKPGMDTRQVISRFEAERQALAMMDHPNIARVIDAGTTDTGRSYFVMDLVKGITITDYCDGEHLTVRERLELFTHVCQAVQHAHQKGIIHRDIKPSNVLVAEYDGKPVPKIIDFGVAKATEKRLTERTMFTEYGQLIGTFEYMSPEQARFNQLDVDTRSDIYSLGVLLYELLAGSTPLDRQHLQTVPFDETLRMIREEEPLKPSTKLGMSETLPAIAANRRTEPDHLSKQIRGELDWIVMKCLEKDRNRRYETASSLARDIEHYLNDEPVQACPPSAMYRLRKYARRNKVALAFATLLIAGLGYLAYSNAAIKRERDAKAIASVRANAFSDLFQTILGSPAPGGRTKGSQYAVRDLLDDYSANLGSQLVEQPEAEAEIRHTLGYAYYFLGVYDRAEPHLKRAIELRRNVNGPTAETLALSLLVYGFNLSEQQRYDEAVPPLREALEIYHRLGVRGDLPLEVLAVLQHVLASSGRHDEAERVIQEAWAEMQSYVELPQEFAVDPETYIDSVCFCAGFADYFARTGRDEEAAEFLRRATLAQKRLRTPDDSLRALQYLAKARLRFGDEAGYQVACRALADSSPRIADDYLNLVRIWTCCLGPDAVDDPSILVQQAEEFAANNSVQAPYIDFYLLGAAHYRAGNYERAAQCLEQSIAKFPSDAPPSHGLVLWPKLFLTMAKWHQGQHDEARRLLHEIQPAIDQWLETPSFYWQYRVTTELLRAEAQATIGQEEKG